MNLKNDPDRLIIYDKWVKGKHGYTFVFCKKNNILYVLLRRNLSKGRNGILFSYII